MIKLFRVSMPYEVDEAVLSTLHSGFVTQGPRVEEFENELRKVINNTKIISLNSGTSALTLALRLAGVQPGDEVISTPMTCVASNVPIMAMGAKIVWADVHPVTGLMDWSSLESRITPKTKAILSVDWAGIPVDYRMIGEIAKENGLIFISDAAHSFGAEHEGVPVGHESLADYHAFSFQAIKLITTVDGGALSMSDDDAFRRGKLLRWFGVDRENTTEFRGELDVEEWGYKFHMNDLNAAIGLAQLPTMNASLAANAAVARMYDDGLDMKFYRSKRHIPYKYKAAHWLYTILLPEMGQQKQFTHYMKDKGIEVSQVHWRNDRLTTFKDFRSTNLKGVDYYADRMICLPIHSNLTLAEVDQVISAANDFVR